MTAYPAQRRRRTRSRAARTTRTVLLGLASLIVVIIIGFVAWAETGVMPAESQPLGAVMTNPRITITENGAAIVMAPRGRASGVGLVFIPGAKVAPAAYLYKLSAAVEEGGLTVVITKPTLNLAFFDFRPLSRFTSEAPGVTTWFVGGHSLGGVRACQYATKPQVRGLILFGSYCANDPSQLGLTALSVSGSEDGLSTPQKVRDAAHLLPATATFVEIAGANHASFGNYGGQAGDGRASVSDEHVRDVITTQVLAAVAGAVAGEQ
ncbi:MAG TPA: alpha/beta hydrolase [Trueperaceae bacterium]|nr:alpha/beta hydrolase [Trueperaceae bacterium]